MMLAYSPTWLGMLLFLTANVTVGMIGHLGIEPDPAWWTRIPVLGLVDRPHCARAPQARLR